MNDPYSQDARLSRLETLTDSILAAIEKLQNKLDGQSKINWAPIAIGVTIFFTVAGSVSTIYNARISTINVAVESIAERVLIQEKGAVERHLKIEVHEERLKKLEKDVDLLKDEKKYHSKED